MQFNHELIPQPEKTVPFKTPEIDHNKRFMEMQNPEYIKKETARLRKEGWIELTLEDIENKFEHKDFERAYYTNIINQGYTILFNPKSWTDHALMYKVVE